MRAAFFEGPRTVTVREVPVPSPGPGEVRLRVRYCGICGSDVSLFKTGALSGPDVVLGHEVSASVDEDPSGAWSPDARVTSFPPRGCGECLWCRDGHPRYCLNPPPPSWGAFAEFVVRPAAGLIAIPEDVDDPAAALVEPLGVALRAVARACVTPGDLVFVSGLGPIGLLTVAALRAAGCRVVGADPRADRRTLASEVGAEVVLDGTAESPMREILALEPRGARAAFECAGVDESLQQVIDACRPRGTIGVLGIPMYQTTILKMTLKEQFAFAVAGPSPESMRAAVAHLRERPRTGMIVTGTVPLERLGDAMASLAEGRGGAKVLVDPRS